MNGDTLPALLTETNDTTILERNFEMKTLALALAATALTATTALAAPGVGSLDTNGDNFASFAEASAVYPTLTQADFRDLDGNNDRRLSNVELTAAGASAILNKHVETASSVLDLNAIDASGDRFASFAEIAAAYPGFKATDFDDIDVNDDNRVSATELYDAEAQAVVSRYEDGSSILVALNELDTNGSNFAEFAELAVVYPSLSSVDFQRVDENNDNRISFGELYSLNAIEVLGKNN